MKKSTKDLKNKTVKELLTQASSLREEIAKLTLSIKSTPPKDTNVLFKKKRELAVLLTVITEKKELENLQTK